MMNNKNLVMSYKVIILFFILLLLSCNDNKKKQIMQFVSEWQGKQIVFPKQIIFTKNVMDTVNYQIPNTEYKILIYIDSIGCTSCKLQLPKWKEFITYMDSITQKKVPFLFFFHSNDYKEIDYLFKINKFDLPVCIDVNDQLNKLNRFPADVNFQAFLLDKNNNVLILGNPIYNLAVKDLYIEQVTKRGNSHVKPKQTMAIAEQTEIDFGAIEISEVKRANFTIKNIGENPLVILDVGTTCGCVTTAYDNQPVGGGEILHIEIVLIPKDIGFLDETVTVKCNTAKSVKFKIRGNVQRTSKKNYTEK